MAERVAPAPPRIEEQEKQLLERRDRFDVSEFNLPPGADVENDILLDATEAYQEFQIPETGERYRLSYDPDQRPVGQRVREGAVAAGKTVAEYVKDPSLPSAEQVGSVASSLEEQTRKAMFGGQATLGDVAGFAAGSGIAGQFGSKPADALGIFLGKTAKNKEGLPVSKGAEGKLRWELSDAASEGVEVMPHNIGFFNDLETMLDSTSPTTVKDVLNHPKLLEAYEDIEDLPVFVDESLGEFEYGYFMPFDGQGAIGINKKLLEDPKEFKRTLMHELQHFVQRKEDFATGTSPYSSEVEEITPAIKKEFEEKQEKLEEVFKTATKNFYKTEEHQKNVSNTVQLLTDLAELKGASGPDFIEGIAKGEFSENISAMEPLWDLARRGEKLLESENLVKQFQDLGSVENVERYGEYIRTPIDKLNEEISFTITNVAGLIDTPQAEKIFKEYIGISPEDYQNLSARERLEYLDDTNFIFLRPKKPSSGALGTAMQARDEAYKRKRGEVEARNTGEARLEMGQQKRKETPPVSTEDRPRDVQWGEPRGFVEGGVVENQMDKLMQEGGMADDGMDRDPVTGNEIPPGSTAKEVRDDVDVKLSEGEYVVPADVVQYYGVKFFENLRDKAKDELKEMDEDGRIGGEPVPDSDDLTEEEMAMLTEALQSDPQGMAKGGMVGQKQVDPYTQQQMMYQQPMGMQQGGVVAPSVPGTAYGNSSLQQMFTPYGASQPAFVPGMPMGGATEFRQYINSETGEIRQFAFMNGQPVTPIPDGFEPYSKEALEKIQQEQQQVQTTGTREESGDGRAGIPDSEVAVSRRSFDPLKGVDFSDPESVKEWAEGKAEKSLLEKGAVGFGAAAPLLGGAAVAALETNDLAQVRAASQMASYLGQEDLATELDDVAENIQSGMGRLPGFLAKEQIAQGDNYFKSALEARLDPSVGGGLDRSQFGSDERFNEVMQEVAPSGMTYQPDRQVYTRDRGDDGDGRAGVSAPKTSLRPAPRPSSKPSPKPSPAGSLESAEREAFGGFSTSDLTDNQDKGGSGGGGDDNKIVCTAMNQSYGFGSFRNAIWLNYASKHLTPEHEKGYHKLFLPLVKLGYERDFKFVRKVLEHIARHRTADIRAEMKNKKRNNLGRFYRAVLEPLCYFVGKFV